MAQAGKGLLFDLTDPLAGHAEFSGHLVERARPAIGDSEAHRDDLAIAFGRPSRQSSGVGGSPT